MHRILSLTITIVSILIASASSAAPILSLTTTSIGLNPTETMITFTVDPNDTPLSGLVFNFSALATGLEILAPVVAIDPQITPSGPALLSGDWVASFGGIFSTDRTLPFDVGTLTLRGLVPGTPLVLSGNYTEEFIVDIPIPATSVAFVVPEPGTLTLVGMGLLGLACRRRRPPN